MARRKKDAPDDPKRDVEAVERISRSTALVPVPLAEPMRLIEDENTGSRFLIYQTGAGAQIDLMVAGESFWATQGQMATMFGVTPQNVSIHLKNIFAEGELEEASVCKESLHAGRDGKRYPTRFYDLNALISVGYRVGGPMGTIFRIWSTDKLIRYLTKGFVVDVRRLKEGGDASRLAEFREIARDLRSEQKNIHDELSTLCAYCADYDPSSPTSVQFFRNTSAKIFYAATKKTPSEVIFERADARHECMGLTNWPTYPAPFIKKHVIVAKNYLDVDELKELNRFTSLLLDFMEDQAEQRRLVMISEAAARIDEFTQFTGRIPLRGGGSRKREDADIKAHAEWEKYKAAQLERKRQIADAQTPDEIEPPKPRRSKKLPPPGHDLF